jgi:methylated-DNA-[protein]-cysteine S-methyltransferase
MVFGETEFTGVNPMLNEEAFEQTVAIWLGDKRAEGEKEGLTTALDALYAAGPDIQRTLQAEKDLQIKLAEMLSQKLYYGVMEKSPIGPIFIAVSDRGVVAIDIGVTELEFVSKLKKKFEGMVIKSAEKIVEVTEQLREYFDGRRTSFKLDLYLNDLTHFQQKVLLATMDIPQGQITTYGEVARRLGKAKWARAVGQALARNPIPIVIPCHRVLAADGSLHGYSGGRGIETKTKLLQLEGVLNV